MAASCRRIGCVQTSRPAACDKNLSLYGRRLDFIALHFPADQRIDRAAAGRGGRALRHAGKAAKALYDLFGPVLRDLSRKEGVRQK